MKNGRAIIKSGTEMLKNFILSKEPINTSRIIPAVLQEDFEESLNSVLEQPTVLECRIEKGIYMISMEHSGIRSGVGTNPLHIIQRISLAVRRFYQKHGVIVHQDEVYIMYSSIGLVIQIALNNYGLQQIRRLNYEQIKALRRKYGC